MRWQARFAWGACSAIITATTFGCEMLAPLDGLSGADAGAATWTPSGAGPDSGTSVDAAQPDVGAGEGASDSSGDGSPAVSEGGAADPDASASAADASDASDAGDAAEQDAAAGVIAFVQSAWATTAGAASSVSATFPKPQSAGDLNVVAIGWNDATSSVSTVTDTSGNVYHLAIGPTRASPDLTQAIYYAKDVPAAGAGANVVTVAFVNMANVADLRVVEYSGLDPVAPLEGAAAGSGNNAGPAASGTVMTTDTRVLLFGAGMTTNIYSAPGSGYTLRLLTNMGDMVEDSIVTSPGAYDAEASLAASCEWILQVAAFH